jgi:hypothetical protein
MECEFRLNGGRETFLRELEPHVEDGMDPERRKREIL